MRDRAPDPVSDLMVKGFRILASGLPRRPDCIFLAPFRLPPPGKTHSGVGTQGSGTITTLPFVALLGGWGVELRVWGAGFRGLRFRIRAQGFKSLKPLHPRNPPTLQASSESPPSR